MWWILLTLGCLALVMWGIFSFWKGVKQVRAADQEVKREMDATEHLSLSEALTKAQLFLREHALTQAWSSSPPVEVDRRLSQLDSALSGLLRTYRKIAFQET